MNLRDKIEAYFKKEFSVCVGLYYPNGECSTDFHTDLDAFGSTKTLPSISLGASRTFSLRPINNVNKQTNIFRETKRNLLFSYVRPTLRRYSKKFPLTGGDLEGALDQV